MKRKERERRKKQLKKFEAEKREWNKDHPVEHTAREKVFAIERLVRFEKLECKEAMKIERLRQKHERYLKRRAGRKLGIIKKLAEWLKIDFQSKNKTIPGGLVPGKEEKHDS